MINEYHFDKLIVGGSLESMLYAYFNNQKILLLDALYPFTLTTTSYHNAFRFIGYQPDETIYTSEMWDRLTFLMSMTGQLVFPNTMKTFREEENKLVVITQHNKRIYFAFDELVEFDKINEKEVSMYDWFNVRSGNNHKHKIIVDNENEFINRLYFYESTRIGKNSNLRDAVGESRMSAKESQLVDHSEGIARLKAISMMRGAGIRGQSNGTSKDGIRLHYAIKLEHTHREIKYDYETLHSMEDILLSEPERGDTWNLTKRLFRHKQITTLQESFRLPASL